MIDERLIAARQATASYHKEYYGKNVLYKPGSWLQGPTEHLAALTSRLAPQSKVLDLGSGVGRNAVRLASLTRAPVTCVDILPEAIALLEKYATENGVGHLIDGIVSPMEHFAIERERYALILAVSCLEHSASKKSLLDLLESIKAGVTEGGSTFITTSAERRLEDLTTGEILPTLVETSLTHEEARQLLAQTFADWQIERFETENYQEELLQNDRPILWRSKELILLANRI